MPKAETDTRQQAKWCLGEWIRSFIWHVFEVLVLGDGQVKNASCETGHMGLRLEEEVWAGDPGDTDAEVQLKSLE